MQNYRLAIAAFAAGLAVTSMAQASVIFSGSGVNPEVGATASGSAMFTIAGDTLTIVLTNTTAPRTTAQGNALTGVTFNFSSGSTTLVLTSTALTGGSTYWTSKTTSAAAPSLAGSWTAAINSTADHQYGVATTGFNGWFNGGSISLGNAAPNYGIVAAGTFDGSNVSFGGSQYPFIQNSMTFTFSGVAGFTEAQIANVKLLFGTDGTGIIQTVPTPGALALVGLGAVACVRRRRA
ncbi:MAG: PEP-CTERM sorting domain-containing protein [Phycisphaeraceae bacterium]|nr:PEP-CTERM sorting domain-containing protein [Phycisphaeraceae bacterium]